MGGGFEKSTREKEGKDQREREKERERDNEHARTHTHIHTLSSPLFSCPNLVDEGVKSGLSASSSVPHPVVSQLVLLTARVEDDDSHEPTVASLAVVSLTPESLAMSSPAASEATERRFVFDPSVSYWHSSLDSMLVFLLATLLGA